MEASFSFVCPSSAAHGMQCTRADFSQQLYGPDPAGVRFHVSSPPTASFLHCSPLPYFKKSGHRAKGEKQFHSAKMTATHFNREENWKATKQPMVCNLVIHQLPDQKQHKGKNGVSLTPERSWVCQAMYFYGALRSFPSYPRMKHRQHDYLRFLLNTQDFAQSFWIVYPKLQLLHCLHFIWAWSTPESNEITA